MAGHGDPGGIEVATARARELAYRYLNQRERTVEEVRRHLSGRDLEPSAVEAAVAELLEAGYLDDARYARLFTEDKRRLAQWGSGRIRSALLARGVDRDVVESALARGDVGGDAEAGAGDDEHRGDEFSRAVALLEQRFPVPPRERRDWQRAFGLLVRRGYEPELATDALTAYSHAHG
ncbi:MAG TPA: RecX family transcriptional regulator [Solirubrobacteraceae bacterium]|nr:RecX family transcriptional regulator [Solirubrobacteraceae bacterium]